MTIRDLAVLLDEFLEVWRCTRPRYAIAFSIHKLDGEQEWAAAYSVLSNDNILTAFETCKHLDAESTKVYLPSSSSVTDEQEVLSQRPTYFMIFMDESENEDGTTPDPDPRPTTRDTIYAEFKIQEYIAEALRQPGMNRFPPRLEQDLQDLESLPLIYSYLYEDIDWLITWSQSTSGTVKAFLPYDKELTDDEFTRIVTSIVKARSIMEHPMGLGYCLYISVVRPSAAWIKQQFNQLLAVVNKIGYHQDLVLSKYVMNMVVADDLSELLRTTSRVADGLCNHNVMLTLLWASGQSMMAEAIRAPRIKNSSMSEAEWRKVSDYIKLQIEFVATELANERGYFELWSSRASIHMKALTSLVAQRDANQTIELTSAMKSQAEESRRIAEATMRDSASMKAIAAVTMFFLPGTFLSALFAIPMFNWGAQAGESFVSPRVWVYFVFMGPITIATIFVWYMWDRLVNQRVEAYTRNREHDDAAGETKKSTESETKEAEPSIHSKSSGSSILEKADIDQTSIRSIARSDVQKPKSIKFENSTGKDDDSKDWDMRKLFATSVHSRNSNDLSGEDVPKKVSQTPSIRSKLSYDGRKVHDSPV